MHLTIVRRITANLIARKSSDIIVEIEINKRIKKLEDILTEISLDVTNAFKILIDSNNYYILASMLTIKLSMATFTIQYLGAIIGKEKFKDEIKSKDILAQYLISFIKEFEDRELELIIRISVASYYYATRGGKEGLKIVEPALEIAKERNNQPRIRKITFMITQFKTRPDLYGDVTQQLEKSSFRSLTESVREHIELLGQDLSDGSDISYALNLGLKDMDPEPYLKYCEKLIIYYAGTSYLGEMFGVQSIGYKLLWCEHSKVTLNYHLDRGFEIHKEHHCDSCKHRKPRLEDWVCTVGWFYNREVPKPIQEFLDKMNQW